MRNVRWILCALALALAACGGPFDGADGPRDFDGDGFEAGPDCNDHDPGIHALLPALVDGDGDHLGAGNIVMLCSPALPPGYAAVDAGRDCDDADGTAWTMRPAFRDQDGDGLGAGERTEVCAGVGLPPRWAEGPGDCDDADVTRSRLVERYEDADGDGIGAGPLVALCAGAVVPAGWSERAGDCAPDDPLRFQELGYLYSDADGDAVLAEHVGTVCSGAELPPRYSMFSPGGLDCDDGDASRFVTLQGYPDTDVDGAGAGAPTSFCTGGELPPPYVANGADCAPDDPARWQLLSYESVDADGDGARKNAAGSICAGAALPAPYSTQWVVSEDCDDANPALRVRLTGYADPDLDGVSSGLGQPVCSGAALPEGWITTPGNDCAPNDPAAWQLLTYYYVDEDGDGRFVNAPGYQGSVCAGAALPANRTKTAPASYDCDDTKPGVWATVYAYLDADGDGVGAGSSTRFCTAGETPDGYSLASTDCAPDDRTRWRSVSYLGVDSDADGYTVRQAGALCLGDEALPDPYRTTLAGADCNDADATLWRYVVLYPDKDGDGIGTTPRIGATCIGAAIPEGTSIFGFDPDDSDPTRRDNITAEASIVEL
jgi:hypothetical protein